MAALLDVRIMNNAMQAAAALNGMRANVRKGVISISPGFTKEKVNK
ncbi:MAG: hypothetical protein IT447_08990 [Phycisphaerales bacterium]|nr:hypothetical protein [Phycisphaerales bacterium]